MLVVLKNDLDTYNLYTIQLNKVKENKTNKQTSKNWIFSHRLHLRKLVMDNGTIVIATKSSK